MGFYSTRSPETGAYVAGKRTEEGTPVYEAASGALGMQKQAAIQNLEKNYATTIENAYASYLANQRGIETSAMGQGYKQAYLEAQDKALQQNIAQAGLSFAENKAAINQNIAEAQSSLQKQYETEVGYIDRVRDTMNNYLTYVKSLRGKVKSTDKTTSDEIRALTTEEEAMTASDLYERLYNLSPKNLYDPEMGQGLSYYEWIGNQLKDTESDTAWRDWLFYSGGYQDFINAVKQRGKTDVYKQYEKSQEEKEQEKSYEESLNSEVRTGTKPPTVGYGGGYELAKYGAEVKSTDGKAYTVTSRNILDYGTITQSVNRLKGSYSQWSKVKELENLKAGDVVTFTNKQGTHQYTYMYIGDNKYIAVKAK